MTSSTGRQDTVAQWCRYEYDVREQEGVSRVIDIYDNLLKYICKGNLSATVEYHTVLAEGKYKDI